MRLLTSRLTISVLAIAIGVISSLWLGTAAKVEAEMGFVLAHFQTVFPIAGLAWLVLMLVRHFMLDREARHG